MQRDRDMALAPRVHQEETVVDYEAGQMAKSILRPAATFSASTAPAT